MEHWIPYIGGAVTAAVGGLVAVLATWLSQRATHRLEHEAKRRTTLLDTYADWAATLDQQFYNVRSVGWKSTRHAQNSPQADAERAALWKEIRLLDTKVRSATYRLLLLEADDERKGAVRAILKQSRFWDSLDGWSEFVEELGGETDLGPPYAKALEALVDALGSEGALR